MARSIHQVLESSDLCGMVLVLGSACWSGMWLPLAGRQEAVRHLRCSNCGGALAIAAVANV